MNVFFDQLRQKAEKEGAIIKIMMVFPATRYKANPTPEQVGQLVNRANTMGLTAEDLYYIFSSDCIPHELNTLIQELSPHWRPSGSIVDTDAGIQWLRERSL